MDHLMLLESCAACKGEGWTLEYPEPCGLRDLPRVVPCPRCPDSRGEVPSYAGYEVLNFIRWLHDRKIAPFDKD